MVGGTCDPATRGMVFNEQTLSMGEGKVTIDVRYGWDGVTVRPECGGPLVQGTGPVGNRWAIRVTNNDTVSWWAHTIGKRGQPRDLELLPGVVNTYSATQAANAGYPNYSACGHCR